MSCLQGESSDLKHVDWSLTCNIRSGTRYERNGKRIPGAPLFWTASRTTQRKYFSPYEYNFERTFRIGVSKVLESAGREVQRLFLNGSEKRCFALTPHITSPWPHFAERQSPSRRVVSTCSGKPERLAPEIEFEREREEQCRHVLFSDRSEARVWTVQCLHVLSWPNAREFSFPGSNENVPTCITSVPTGTYYY